MICTVTFNPSLDYIVRVDDMRLGAINRTTYEQVLPGGKGVNVSIVLGNLGHASRALGFVAGFTGDELVRLCAAAFGWKKSTTYTMLRRLCQRGLFQNDGGTVSACMSEAEFRAMQCERFVSDAFDGSLPQFVAAFTSRRPLRADEVEELQRMIADCEVRT